MTCDDVSNWAPLNQRFQESAGCRKCTGAPDEECVGTAILVSLRQVRRQPEAFGQRRGGTACWKSCGSSGWQERLTARRNCDACNPSDFELP